MISHLLTVLLCGWITLGQAQVELGQVDWLRDMEAAKERSQQLDKPIFIWFQEVPGCMTCQRFGQEVMSDPFIIEVIEDEFIPLCIYNNRGGEDARILKQFGEPSWNNPVMRITDGTGASVSRLAGGYTKGRVLRFIIDAMASEGMKVPEYIDLYYKDVSAAESELNEAIFSTPCFWSGEAAVGDIEGVVFSEAGWMNDREVVRLKYDPLTINFQELVSRIGQRGCLSQVFTDDKKEKQLAGEVIGSSKVSDRGKYRRDDDTKYYLQNSPYRKIDMFDLQTVRVNHCLGEGGDCDHFLSPGQLALIRK